MPQKLGSRSGRSRLLQGKASDVAAGIRRSATLQNLSTKERENADKCANYLLKYSSYLHDDHYLAQGYPIPRESLKEPVVV